MTNPLPKTRSPVLKKKRKSLPVMADTEALAIAAPDGGARSNAAGDASERPEDFLSPAGGANRKTPTAPATRKSGINSFFTMTVMLQAMRKTAQAGMSRP